MHINIFEMIIAPLKLSKRFPGLTSPTTPPPSTSSGQARRGGLKRTAAKGLIKYKQFQSDNND
jgi:hypothetical protein